LRESRFNRASTAFGKALEIAVSDEQIPGKLMTRTLRWPKLSAEIRALISTGDRPLTKAPRPQNYNGLY
jgi:hypothetical protein